LAAAINREFDYVKVSLSSLRAEGASSDQSAAIHEFVILAKGRLPQLGDVAYEVVEEMKGESLIGRRYEPPFSFMTGQSFDQTNAWKIWHADYVELGEEGTGAVHIAPAYGEDDMQLAKQNGVPIVHHVDESGRFKDWVTGFNCALVKPKDDDTGVDHKDTDIEILKSLQAASKIFKKENITHSYPHCWRCDTPLLNYATTSWFVNVPKIKDELVAVNNGVYWVPNHVHLQATSQSG
jgi:isoleucyl-tRNA synthetase